MTLLPEVEQALLDAVSRDQAARRTSRLQRIRMRSLRLPALALFLLLGTTTLALAASGVILTGSNVPGQRHPRPGYGLGVPALGRSMLLPLRAPDPAGGLPWGMRVVRTTRGYLCLEFGRVESGRLGELGIDGAFHDDGLFHPLPVHALPEGVDAGFNVVCGGLGDSGFAGTLVGLERGGASNLGHKTDSRSAMREISYGLLGQHARTITYSSEDGVKTTKVLPGLGAYLVVRRATHGGQLDSLSESPVAQSNPVVNPGGALKSITYSFGKRTCTVMSRTGNALAECGLHEPGPPPKPKPLPVVHVHPHVQLVVHDHTITAGYLIFRAPYAVTSAAESYTEFSNGCGGEEGGSSIQHDVVEGAMVHMSIASDLSFTCSRSVQITLYYVRSLDDNLAPTQLATVTVRLPHDDHPKPLPRSERERLRKLDRAHKHR